MTPQYCTVHPSVMLVTTPRADEEGNPTKWGCAVCNMTLLHRLHLQFSVALQAVQTEMSAQDMLAESLKFEEWARLIRLDLSRTTSEKYYRNEMTALAWITWLASARMQTPIIVEMPLMFSQHFNREVLRSMARENKLLRYDELSGVLLLKQYLPLSKLAQVIQG